MVRAGKFRILTEPAAGNWKFFESKNVLFLLLCFQIKEYLDIEYLIEPFDCFSFFFMIPPELSDFHNDSEATLVLYMYCMYSTVPDCLFCLK